MNELSSNVFLSVGGCMGRAFLVALFLFYTLSYSGHITVGPSGCDFTDLNAAINKHAAYDLIEIKNGPALYKLNSRLILKKGVVLYSSSSAMDTIEGIFEGYGIIEFSGDSITLKNVFIRFPTYSGVDVQGYAVYSNNFGGHKLFNCHFQQHGDGPGTGFYRRGICLNRSDSSVITEPTLIRHCIFDSLSHSGCTNTNYDKVATHVTIDSCVMNGAGGGIGEHYIIRNNIYNYGTGKSTGEIAVCGDSILFEYNYFNGRGDGGEMLSWDEQNKISKGCIFRYNVMDSVDHMAVCHDGVENFIAEYNNIIIPYNREIPAFGSHGQNMLDICKNVRIEHNTIGCKPLMMRGENISHENVSFLLNVATGRGFEMAGQTWSVNVKNDTIGECVYVQKKLPDPQLKGNFDVIFDTVFGIPISSLLIDTTQRYPYLKRNSKALFKNGSLFAGSRKYLVDTVGYPISDQSSFFVNCQIDSLFWYNDPIGKDSGTVTLQTSSPENKIWKNQQNSGVQKAGYKGKLLATGVSGPTYYRLLFQGTTKTGKLADTTQVCSLFVAVDTIKPKIKILSPENNAKFAISSQLSIKWDVEDNGFITSSIITLKSVQQGSIELDNTGCKNGISEKDLPTKNIKPGSYTLSISVADAASNLATDSINVTFFAPPELASPAVDTAYLGQKFTYQITVNNLPNGAGSIIAQSLPTGLELKEPNTITGIPSGEPRKDSCVIVLHGEYEYCDTVKIALAIKNMSIVASMPQPFQIKDSIRLNIKNNVEINLFSKSKGIADITFYDLSGKIIIGKHVPLSQGCNQFRFEKKEVPNGTYLVAVTYANMKKVTKIQITH